MIRVILSRLVFVLAVMFVAAPEDAYAIQDGESIQQDDLQDPPRRRRGGRRGVRPQEAPPPPEPDIEESKPKKDEPDRWFAVQGARVHTVSGPVLDGVTVLCKNGVIHDIGRNVQLPEDCEVLDASGHEMYPGLIAVRMTGLLGGGSPDDSTDPYTIAIAVARAAGITTGFSSNTAAKLNWDTLDDMVIRSGVFETLRYTTRSPQQRRRMRNDMQRVRDHIRAVRLHAREKKRNPDAEAPDDKWIRGDFAKYKRLIEGDAVAMADANTAHEILQLCELAEQFGITFVVRGAIEGWTVAEEMARANMSAMVTPRIERGQDESLNRPTGSTIRNAAILREHGVPVAFIPVGSLFGPGTTVTFGGLAGRDLTHLAMSAAFAVRGGLSNDEAVRGLTLDAARILRIDDQVGSIEVGKDADFVITDGDLLHYMTHARWTICNGRVVYDKLEETLYDHIRPNGDRNAPPPDDHWPRRLGDLELVTKAAEEPAEDEGASGDG